jgi:hypothetical protein
MTQVYGNTFQQAVGGPAELVGLIFDAVPAAVKRGDKEGVETLERRLAMGGLACPNALSPLWNGPPDVPRNESQVREMYAYRMPDYGYRVAASQIAFPDWCLQDLKTGEFLLAEVEHRSSSFLAHDHPREGCDLIVCWEHNVNIPFLPVLELFSGTLHEAAYPQDVDPLERAKAFGTYAASQFAKRDGKARQGASAGGVGNDGAVLYDKAMERAARVVACVDRHVERGLSKTDSVMLAADECVLGKSTVWAILKKRGEFGL